MPIKILVFSNHYKKENDVLHIDHLFFKDSPLNSKHNEIVLNVRKKLEKESINNILFPSLFDYNDTSLWWFFYETFFYKLKEIINFILPFTEFITQENLETIKIEKNFDNFYLIEQICIQNNIPLIYSKIDLLNFNLKQKFKKTIRNYVRDYKLKKRILKRINSNKKIYFSKYSKFPDITNKIIFASPTTYRRSIFDPFRLKSQKGEYLIQPIIDLLHKKYDLVGLSISHTIPGITENILTERISSDFFWFPEEIFLKKTSKKHREFLRKYKELISSRNFQNLFTISGISYWKNIQDIFQQMLYAPYFSYWLNLIDSLSANFEKYPPKTIFLTSEIDAPGLAIIEAAKKHNITTIAIQQGIISEQGPAGYLHDEFIQNKKCDYPFPTKILTFGEIFNEVLIRNGFPSNSIITFGNPTYFNLEESKNELSFENIYKKYNIDSSKKIILFTTTQWQEAHGYTKHNYDTQTWKYLLKIFKSNNDYFIILKPHPLENINLYQKILSEEKNNNVKIIQGNLFELFLISNVIVSNPSTVIIDAIMSKKYVIELKWDEIDEKYLKFENFGVIFPSRLENLYENIDNVLTNSNIRISLEENRPIFLKNIFNFPMDEKKSIQILNHIIDNK